jgi:hypothetical protein
MVVDDDHKKPGESSEVLVYRSKIKTSLKFSVRIGDSIMPFRPSDSNACLQAAYSNFC